MKQTKTSPSCKPSRSACGAKSWTMIGEAKSGHPGGSLSAVEILTTLYFDVMRPRSFESPSGRIADRFILSKATPGPVLYCLMAETGYTPLDH